MVPIPGDSGTLTTSTIGAESVTLNWTKGTDNKTEQSNLEYLVYFSTSDNIDTISNIETNGTTVGSFIADINTKEVTDLSEGTTYYFNVLIKDQAGNKSAYTSLDVKTTIDIGSGTLEEPYKIRYIEDLAKIGSEADGWDLDKHYILVNDLDFKDSNSYKSGIVNTNYTQGEGWQPIGNSSNPFIGSFDGNGKKINHLYINRDAEDYIGLFGYIGSNDNNDDIIKFLALDRVNISGNSFVGGISGNNNHGTIENCYSGGTISCINDYSGGIAGQSYYGVIKNSYSIGNISSSDSYAGGVVGCNNHGTIEDCYSIGEITVNDKCAGGIAGENSGTIKDCIAFNSKIEGKSLINRFVGSSWGGAAQVNNYANNSMIVFENNVIKTDNPSKPIDWGMDISTMTQIGWSPLSNWDFYSDDNNDDNVYWKQESGADRPVLYVDPDEDGTFEKLGDDDGLIPNN